MRNLIRETFLYVFASGLGMVADVSVLWLLVEVGHLHYLLAASIAFLVGTVVVYALSVGVIFRHRRIDNRRLEFGVFAGIGVLGLLTNLTVLKISVDHFGLHYMVGKLVSVVFTFSMNFGLRRMLLFTARASEDAPLHRRGSAG